jgi:hypothetical protein
MSMMSKTLASPSTHVCFMDPTITFQHGDSIEYVLLLKLGPPSLASSLASSLATSLVFMCVHH